MSTATSENASRSHDLRRAFSVYPTGVMALAGVVDGRPVGMAVNSFTSISLDPALVAVSAAKTSRTWPVLSALPELGMSVLANTQEPLSRLLSSRDAEDRFAHHVWNTSAGGAVLLEGAALWLTCRPYNTVDAGDHVIGLYEILDVTVFEDVEPLLFHQSRYRAIRSDNDRD